ncbi:type II toxin-antitoxin system Phd/YefM family antitoxin [Coraliomargarita sinensis]|uniref:type II toxin-antitoxin system Phd/YefM family antitoxin n=1 Tax=Coraliomargarita sinensis TaxID=2174842 RepID=UPI001E562AAB|nr:type II toxin-antitoxin system Phd/YefM family antitoxin [Coraliomargarita sinensis]
MKNSDLQIRLMRDYGLARVNVNLFTNNPIDPIEQLGQLGELMDSVKASYFKNHFGAVLDRAGQRAIRIERRGRAPAILISEAEYRAMQQRSLSSADQNAAMEGLRALAKQAGVADLTQMSVDPRAKAILKKHAKHEAP